VTVAIEAQAFSLKAPGLFFSMYAPPRTESEYKAGRERLEEDIRFVAKRVCPLPHSLRPCLMTVQIANVCILLNEYPYIRYYLPAHHQPLGAFKPHASTRSAPPPQAAGQWRTNLARGETAREYESVESDFVTKVLAFTVQQELDAHKKANAEFPVGAQHEPTSCNTY
jgi:syntaxin-binding protein 1